MSSPLAIGAVSAVLRNLLDNGMIEVVTPMGSLTVSAVAPDTIRLDDPQAEPRLNLFLYRVTPNLGWQNMGLPSVDGNGARRNRPPLAIDLHYLLTAYGRTDFQAEILLGYAMHLLHERPVLDREAIRTALDPSPLGPSILPPEFQALSVADLADQLEAVTVTQEPMDTEEMSRLWSAIQSHYRPTVAYVVTVVLIESQRPVRTPLPVLSRGGTDTITGRERGALVEPSLLPPYPTIERVDPPEPTRPAVHLGDQIRIRGHHLAGTSITVSFEHRLLDEPNERTLASNDDETGFNVTIPSNAAAQTAWPAGVYTVTATLTRSGEPMPSTTNVVAMLLAPEPTLPIPPADISRDPTTLAVTLTLGVRPRIRPTQKVTLSLGGATAVADPHPSVTNSVDFTYPDLDAGDQWIRLTVDGVESLLLDRSTVPPRFDPTQVVDVP